MCQNKDTRKAYSLMKKQLSLDENAVTRKKTKKLTNSRYTDYHRDFTRHFVIIIRLAVKDIKDLFA